MTNLPDQEKIRERIVRLIYDKFDGKRVRLAEAATMDQAKLSKLLSGATPLRRKDLVQIEQASGARLLWLEKGVEPMYHQGPIPNRAESIYHQGVRLREFMEQNGIKPDALGSAIGHPASTVYTYFNSENFHQSVRSRIMTGLRQLKNDANLNEAEVFHLETPGLLQEPSSSYRTLALADNDIPIRRMPIAARAGFDYHAFFVDNQNEPDFAGVSPSRLFPNVPPERHVIVEVNGDSMEPALKQGYEMLAYHLPRGQYPPINRIVMIDFHDQLTIKRLVAIDYVADTVSLRSDNGGAEIRIPTSAIRNLWHVYDYHTSNNNL